MKDRKRQMKIKKAGLFMVLGLLIVSSIAIPTLSDDYDPQDTHTGSLVASTSDVEVGDTFNVTLFINSGTDTVTSFAVRQILFNDTRAGIANVTTNPGGTPNVDLNCSFPGPWGGGTFTTDDGNLDNAAGNHTYGPQSFTLGAGISGNKTGAVFNFTALECGVLNITIPPTIWSGQSGLDIGLGAADSWSNTSVTVHPADPAAIGATYYNGTVINVTFTPGAGGNTTILCGKTGSYPTSPTDNLLYNGTNTTFNHTSLTNCTEYWYRAWTFNVSEGLVSTTYRQTREFTECGSNFSFAGESPTDASTTANCTYSIPVNVTVINTGGHTWRWWINCTNGQSWNGVGRPANTSTPVRTMTGLLHNTEYWWNVTVADGNGDSANASYNFTTGNGGGATPGAPSNLVPTSSQQNVTVSLNLMSVDVTDADSDTMTVYFYWGNDTEIDNVSGVASGATASITPGLSLNYSDRYFWHVIIDDGCNQRRGPAGSAEYWFDTEEPGIRIEKTATVHTNNTIQMDVNISNTGAVNLTSVYFNETYDSDVYYVGSTPHVAGDNTSWKIPFLNRTGYENCTHNITIWLNVSWPVANGTTITNTITAESAEGATGSSTITPLVVGYTITKEANVTYLEWNTTSVNFTINVTNTGDFYLNWLQINETYDGNYTYVWSNVTPSNSNQTFNITTLNPSEAFSLLIEVNTSYAGGTPLINSSYHWNNVTSRTNETFPYNNETSYLIVGARTTQIRIIYDTFLTEVGDIGDSVFNILAAVLVIGAILLIIYVVRIQQGTGE